jgi:hypothetical protein
MPMQNLENPVDWGSDVYDEDSVDIEGLGVVLGVDDPDLFEAVIPLEACWRKGPLGICTEIVDGGKAVKVVARLAGRRILRATLSRERQCVETEDHVGVAKVELSACADLDNRVVRIEGSLCLQTFDGSVLSSIAPWCADDAHHLQWQSPT